MVVAGCRPYQPHYKPNQLICGTGQTAVVTGWTVKGAIAKKLQPHDYAVIGQLYSPTRGISVLIRNLLLNPQVRFLVIVNATKEDQNAGGCQCLIDFLQHGVKPGKTDTGRDCWSIQSLRDARKGTPITGYIDIEITADVLESLRQSIEWSEARSIAEAVHQVQAYAARERMPAWGSALTFPQEAVTPTTLPGIRYGHRIEGNTIAETWVKIIHRIKTTGTIRPTAYDGYWQELIDLVAIVTAEPDGFYFPEPNYLPVDRAFIGSYISQVLDDAPDREGVKYTYGQRLRSWFGRDQIQQVIDKLAADLNSARAVMSLWDVHDHETGDSPPCLNHIWVRVVDGELSLTATFRSNDMFSAWPANAMGLRALQQYILEQVNNCTYSPLTLGPLITISQSAHIYDDCWENSDRLIETQYPKVCQQRDYDDPVGSFLITVQPDTILVEHLTPGSGEVINCYSGRSATQLYRQMAIDCPALQPEHALYLGAELQKAELALTLPNQFIYEQDKPLKSTKAEG